MTEKMMDETRLLKQFCKGIAVYGSDVKNQGFSGYICELLVIKYKTFLGVLKAASLWSAPQIIFFGEKPQKRFSDPLIIIDPTDACRNAAANVSADNFVKFVEKARQILKRPAKKYFFPEKPMPLSTKEIAELKKRGTLFVAIEMKKPGVIDDILYPQLRRSLKRLDGILRENEFVVVRSYEWIGKEMVLFFEMEVWSLPLIKKMVGPPIFSKVHSKEFLSKYSKNALFKPYVEDKRWVAERPREFIKATDLLSFFARKSMKDLEASGIPSYIAKPMKKSKIVENVWMLVKKQKDFSAFLHEKYFS
jgi:tRNA nucleotidyltransferase (CCA-adding enzyme)